MQDMLAKASAWFEQQRTQHLAAMVAYYRAGVSHPVNCRATPLVGRWDAINATGQMVRIETRDFVIADAELGFVPARGDTIVVTEGGTEKTYKVIQPDGSMQCWRWVDRNQNVRRIHTLELEQYPRA